ncbi:MAG TPA: PAS domain-containing protein, partial [Deferrisomatales bacterium]|nr:PAS domain-containing protein [Deferrisomatales bacterium]
LETLADAGKNAVRTWIRERRADAQVLAWDPDLIDLCIEGTCPKGLDPARLLSHLENHRFFSGFLGAYLFTPSGEALLAAEGGAPPCPEASVRARQAAREKRFLLHDIHRGEDGTPMIGFLAPVFHRVDPQERPEDAPVLGVVGIYLDPRDTLFPTLSGVGHYAWAAETYLVRREGNGVRLLTDARGAPPAPGVGLLSLPGEQALEHSAAVDGERSGRFLDFRGTRVLAAVRWISEAGWGLVSKVDEEQALAAWRRQARAESVLVASVVLCLLLGGIAAQRWWSGLRYRLLLEGVRDREERLRALAQGSEDVVFLKGTDGRFLLVNPVAATLLGTSPEAALGKRTGDYLDPAVTRILESHDQEVMKTGTAYQGEEVIPHGGQQRIFLSSRVPIRDSHGNLQGVAGVLRDITQRKRDEQALARWAQTLAALYRLARGLTSAADVRAVHTCLLDGAGEALAANLTALYVVDAASGNLRLSGGRNVPAQFADLYDTLAADQGVAGELSSQGELLAISDCSARSGEVARFAAEAGIISLLAVPLRGAGGVAGLLVLGFIAPREFRPDEGEALALLGHMAGVAADRCRALESLAAEADVRRRAEERLRQLYAATSGFTGEELFQRVAGTVAAELGAKLVLVSKVIPGHVAVPCAAVRDGLPAEVAPYSLDGTPCQQVVRRAEFVHLADGLQLACPEASFLAGQTFAGYVGVPLTDSDGRVIGLVCAFHDAPLPLDTVRRDLLELYALRLSGEMARLLAEDQLSEARRALDTLIENLPGAVYRSDWLPSRPLQFISAGSRVVSGYGPAELLGGGGVALGDLVVAEDRSRVWRDIQVAVAEARPYEV